MKKPGTLTSVPRYTEPLMLMAAVFIAKLLIFVWDHQPRLFLGDSGSYIETAISGWIPPDRTFFYGYCIRWLGLSFHSLTTVVLAQVCASALTVGIAAAIVRDTAPVRRVILWGFCTLMALAPVQLIYERFIMAECFSALWFIVYIALSLRYISQPKLQWLILLAGISFMLVALRVSLLPNILFGCFGLWLITFLPSRQNGCWQRPHLHLTARRQLGQMLLFLICTGGALYTYQRIYASFSGNPPGFHSRQGYFLLASVSPLLTRDDFADPGLQQAVFGPGGVDLANPDMRNAQMFAEQGLLPRMDRYLGGPNAADQLARNVAIQVIRKHPLAFFKLGWQNARLYLNHRDLAALIRIDQGFDRPLPESLRDILNKRFEYRQLVFPDYNSICGHYFENALGWYMLLVVGSIPLALVSLAFAIRGARRTAFAALHLLISIGVTIWLAPAGSVRYLHTVEMMFILTTALAMCEMVKNHGARKAAAPCAIGQELPAKG